MLSISTSLLAGPFKDRLKAISAAGFDAIDLDLTDVAQFGGSIDELRATIAAAGLQVSALGPLPADAAASLINAKIALAKSLGAGCLVVGFDSMETMVIPDPDGIRIAVRPTRRAEDAAIRAITDAHDPLIGLALDSFAVLGDRSRPARLRDIGGAKVFHVTMCDGPQKPMLPGQGTLNLGGFARVLARAGYDGPWSVGNAVDAETSVLNAYRALANALSDAAETEPLLRPATPRLPQKVPVRGVEFVEFTVDAESARELEGVLETLAFRRERQHRSKDVTLWRQGAINIVINRDGAGHAADAFAQHGPCVCDMGLRVGDARQTVARAEALGSAAFAQDVALGELSIPAIRGVGGGVIHFIDENSDLHRVWDIEFEPLPQNAPPPPAGLRRIDHVAQTMRYDEMQNWLLFYLTTFEMTKEPIVNVADPSGVVRSQALATPEGEVRLNLNGAAGAATLAGSFVSGQSGAGVQHLAFSSDDIFETSDHLHSAGFTRLAIPLTYYADTQSAFDLSDAMTEQLRAHNVLYDQDEHGAYFQLYGCSIFGGFFFEIVQRTGRYAGYGARNAPIRLAAQTHLKIQGGAA
ncbi:bifunctional sugar phosphate isomerase/epimerase/4-hydroxyphenylpyruvate dioxygenase family protein [Pontivivens insulae]|uniref:4-hydroxyphenylpyruvate dioxygenase n=1 Tax=Pontivivens insulae TaxID=1639689 RepID=A0A2R8A930_9RHOB|nr:sugar phosphate isomerase/epimerase and 4-hydroxyphenylpyruvate domain-containing protein [Pontivivens insulae]RED18826.1 4-hydroxyphenylpyruvate dioxygenase [Pontivivens insulae]SPF28726.1 4-hydroxyphenylpyruvate dioxygenase [Pontivivens insulae]